MMRKFTYYLLAFFAIFFVNGCNEEDVSSPPSSSFTVDKTSGLSDDTEFTFVIDQVNAKSIALLPYGTDHASLGGILVTSFTDGKATVKFKYPDAVGTFNAVVVTSNYSSDGEEVKRSYSAETAITITSDKSEMTSFKFEKSTKDSIADDNSIWVTVPYATDITTLKAIFGTSPFADVTVGGTAQVSETTANNFSAPVQYKVTADNGTSSTTYTVHVAVTPIETDATVKSFGAKSIGKQTKDQAYGSYVNEATGQIVVLLPYETPGGNGAKDSLRVSYTMNGAFAKIRTDEGGTLKQDSLLDLSAGTGVHVEAITQDSATVTHDYTIKAAIGPKLELAFPNLIPPVTGKTTGYDIALNVLTGTNVASIVTTATLTEYNGIPASITKVNGAPFVSGVTAVNYTDPAKFTVLVIDPVYGTYEATFTAKVTVLK
ncbi:MAG: hypothetical protein ABI663_05040 [Chryseolinea sp.]